MEIALGKNTFLKNISEIGDSDETNIASAIPAVMQFLKATKKCDANESDSEELFFEEVNQIDSTFATDVMKTRIANVDELRQLRIQDSRKKSIKLGLIALGFASVIALLIVLYSISFTTVENTLTWPCDKNGQFLGNFIESQIGSFSTGQFSLSVPFINGVSSVVKKNDSIIVIRGKSNYKIPNDYRMQIIRSRPRVVIFADCVNVDGVEDTIQYLTNDIPMIMGANQKAVEQLKDGDIIFALPLKFKGIEAAPVRLFALKFSLDEKDTNGDISDFLMED